MNVARLRAKWSRFTKRLSFGNSNGSAVLINHLDAQPLTSSPSPFSLGPKTFFPSRPVLSLLFWTELLRSTCAP